MIHEKTRLIDVTVGELMDYIKENVKLQPEQQPTSVPQEEKWIYGIKAFAKRYHKSESVAHNIRHSGKLGDAVVKGVRNVIFDKQKCDELFAQGKF